MTTIYNGHGITQVSNMFYIDANRSVGYSSIELAQEFVDMQVQYEKKDKARRYATFGTGFVNLEPRDQQHLETQFKL